MSYQKNVQLLLCSADLIPTGMSYEKIMQLCSADFPYKNVLPECNFVFVQPISLTRMSYQKNMQLLLCSTDFPTMMSHQKNMHLRLCSPCFLYKAVSTSQVADVSVRPEVSPVCIPRARVFLKCQVSKWLLTLSYPLLIFDSNTYVTTDCMYICLDGTWSRFSFKIAIARAVIRTWKTPAIHII
jgi:hypothetical protein